MAIENRNGRIYLTKETAHSFMKKLKNNNPEVRMKRDKFLAQSKEKIRVEKTSTGSIIIINK